MKKKIFFRLHIFTCERDQWFKQHDLTNASLSLTAKRFSRIRCLSKLDGSDGRIDVSASIAGFSAPPTSRFGGIARPRQRRLDANPRFARWSRSATRTNLREWKLNIFVAVREELITHLGLVDGARLSATCRELRDMHLSLFRAPQRVDFSRRLDKRPTTKSFGRRGHRRELPVDDRAQRFLLRKPHSSSDQCHRRKLLCSSLISTLESATTSPTKRSRPSRRTVLT